MYLKHFYPALLGLAVSPVALAEAAYTLDEIVVTATRMPQKQNEVAGDVNVLTRADIDRAGQATLAELLRTLPGVEIVQNGGAGAVTSVFLRGASSGHTLILVDGVRMTSATLGSARLEHIPVGLIERIEVVRGPMSHLYGSEAIGGVIQIFTRKADGEPRLTASLGVGAYGHRSAEASVGGSAGDWRYVLAAGHDRQDGFSAKPAAYADQDGYRNNHASLRTEYDLSADHQLDFHGFLSDGLSHFDDGVTPYDSHSDARLVNLGVGLVSRLGEHWDSTLRVDRATEDVKTQGYSDPLPWFAGGPYASRIGMAQWQYGWQLDGRTGLGDVQLLAERLDQDISGDVGYTRDQRSRDALGVTWRKQVGGHGFSASLRRDDDSQFGGHDTGAFAYSLRFASAWHASLSWGTAFKAPGFDDLYWPGAGNPDLRPETSENREIGLKYDSSRRAASAIVYRNDVTDLIQWAPNSSGDWLPANVASARLQGLSLAWIERLGAWSLRASLDLQSPENADTGKRLILRSRRHGSVAAEYAAGPWRLSAELVGQGVRYNDADNTVRLDAYTLVNLTAGYALTPAWRLDARLDNA
ncbi:MAG: TonB-dependent receptor, partial [Hydrogenophilaceae bacterium]